TTWPSNTTKIKQRTDTAVAVIKTENKLIHIKLKHSSREQKMAMANLPGPSLHIMKLAEPLTVDSAERIKLHHKYDKLMIPNVDATLALRGGNHRCQTRAMPRSRPRKT
ncbi:hypothetical protein N9L68_08300, partial [bacterium]|nr:hypothetical protein [bacterium]